MSKSSSSVQNTPDAADFAQQGAAAWKRGNFPEAANYFTRAALLDPQKPDYHVNLGVCLRKLGRIDASIVCYRRALALRPDDGVTLSNLGNSCREAGYLEEAEQHLQRACALSPQNQSFLYNLALVVRDRRRHQEARDRMQALLDHDPNNAEIAWDLALSDLYLMDYERGWRGYETRWRLERAVNRPFPGVQWRANMPLQGKTLLIVAEQGFGDALQFARFLPLLAERGARLVVECQPELMDLFAAQPCVAQVIAKQAPPPPYDYWLPIMSLAWVLGVTPDTLPVVTPYLNAPAGKVFVPPALPGVQKHVGLIWAGKMTPRDRSWPLAELLPLLHDPRLTFWSLQMGDRVKDLSQSGAGSLVRDIHGKIQSFADSAAIMAGLDLIITIDTSACHLAGALGRPTWVLLRYVSDWRWRDEPTDCLWYPTMRLFRQSDPMDFSGPVRQMGQALQDWLASAP